MWIFTIYGFYSIACAASGVTAKPAIKGHFKTGHFRVARVT